MEALAESEVFLFEEFRLDRRGGGLFRRDDSGAFAPVAIGSRGLDILRVLIERAGEVASKDDIIGAVWPGTVVEDSNLTVQISALRRVLDQRRSQGGCIQTVAGRGYRFAAPVTRVEANAGVAGPLQSGALTPPRLSIVVLPFASLSNDAEQEYLAHGITDDVTTDLSGISGSFVISRNTAFTYGNKLINTKLNWPRVGRAVCP
jgi:DNA-binding winged helix-turn-helix (wHTH) protein